MSDHKQTVALAAAALLLLLGLLINTSHSVEVHERAVARRAIQRHFGKTREDAEKILDEHRNWEKQEYGDAR